MKHRLDANGQLVPNSRKPLKKPRDVPEIVNGYIDLVAGLVHSYREKETKDIKPVDVKNIISLGRSVAMLQVIEVNKLANVGNKAVKDYSTEELQWQLSGGEAKEETDEVETGAESE